jgi:Tfp pilus assembly protein PilV
MQRDSGSLKRVRVTPLKRAKLNRFNASTLQRSNGFALYEVLLGVAIFAVGVLALGRAVENCMNASMLNAEEDAVRQILSNRMAEIQAARGAPDSAKEDKVDSGYGMVKLLQKSAPAELTEPNNTQLNGINLVILTAQWQRGGVSQSKQIKFYVYRPK